eukprot:gene10257-7789_t
MAEEWLRLMLRLRLRQRGKRKQGELARGTKASTFKMFSEVFVMAVAVMAATPIITEARDCEVHTFADATRMLQSQRCLELEVTKAEPPSASDSTSVAGFDEFLSTLRNNKDVRSFELSGCKLGDENIGKVVETLVLRERDLYSLELPGNEITDEGIQHVVAFLQKSNALRSLNLGRNRISDAGVSILVNALPSQLHELELYANSIGNAGLLSILNAAAPHRSLPAASSILYSYSLFIIGVVGFYEDLKEIELHSNLIDDEGAKAAAELLLESAPTLYELDLRENPIEDEGRAALGNLQSQRNNSGRKIKVKYTTLLSFKDDHTADLRHIARRVEANNWDENKVKEWVMGLHPQFQQYSRIMEANAVNGDVLMTLNDQDLADIGIDSPLHRRRLLTEIEKLKRSNDL